MRSKSRVPIRNDFLREAKPWVDMFKVQGGYPWSSDCDRAREEYSRLGTSMVNNGKDGIFSLYAWESCDKIHGDLLKGEGVFRACDMVEGNSRPMSKILVLLAYCTSCNVVGDPGFHPFPF